jgi:hypothetical protein
LVEMNPRVPTVVLVMLAVSVLGEAWYIVSLHGRIDWADLRISSLQYQNTELTERCIQLETNMSGVVGEFEAEIKSLEADYSELEAEHGDLISGYRGLEAAHYSLQRARDELQGRYDEYVSDYEGLRREVNSRLGLEDTIMVRMMEVTGGREAPGSEVELLGDYKALHDWIRLRIDGSADSPYPYLDLAPSYPVRWVGNSVRFPGETLEDMAGDCEDQAILLLSMMIAYGEGDAKWCISYEWSEGAHVAVSVPVQGGGLIILDPAAGYHTGTASTLIGRPVEEAIDGWIGKWEEKGVFISSIFNAEMRRKFSGTEEFLEWFQANYK